MNRLRGAGLIPRGVYRFARHEETDEWTIRTIASNSRAPELEDLLTLCKALNAQRVRYALIGGFAVILHGFVPATKDIDLLGRLLRSRMAAHRLSASSFAICSVESVFLMRMSSVRCARLISRSRLMILSACSRTFASSTGTC